MYEIFEMLLKEKGLKAADVCRATGIKSPVFSEWKKGKSTPKQDKMIKIAKFLGVSVEYLMTGEETEKEGVETYYLNDETAKTAQEIYENDKILFDVYRSSDKNRLIEYAKKLMELRKMEEGDD